MKNHVCRRVRLSGVNSLPNVQAGWNGARVNGWLSWKSLTKSQPRRLRSWNTSGWNHGDAPKKMRWGDLMWPNPPKKPLVFHFFYGRTYRKPLYNYWNRKAMVPRHTGQSSSCSIIQEVPWRRQNGHEELLLLCNTVTFPVDMPSKLPSWKIAPQVSWPWWQNVTNIANCNVLSNDPLISVSPWPRSHEDCVSDGLRTPKSWGLKYPKFNEYPAWKNRSDSHSFTSLQLKWNGIEWYRFALQTSPYWNHQILFDLCCWFVLRTVQYTDTYIVPTNLYISMFQLKHPNLVRDAVIFCPINHHSHILPPLKLT